MWVLQYYFWGVSLRRFLYLLREFTELKRNNQDIFTLVKKPIDHLENYSETEFYDLVIDHSSLR